MAKAGVRVRHADCGHSAVLGAATSALQPRGAGAVSGMDVEGPRSSHRPEGRTAEGSRSSCCPEGRTGRAPAAYRTGMRYARRRPRGNLMRHTASRVIVAFRSLFRVAPTFAPVPDASPTPPFPQGAAPFSPLRENGPARSAPAGPRLTRSFMQQGIGTRQNNLYALALLLVKQLVPYRGKGLAFSGGMR